VQAGPHQQQPTHGKALTGASGLNCAALRLARSTSQADQPPAALPQR
jgi:hypothetical protein